MNYFRADEGSSKLRILLRQVEQVVEFFAAGAGPELSEPLGQILHEVATLSHPDWLRHSEPALSPVESLSPITPGVH